MASVSPNCYIHELKVGMFVKNTAVKLQLLHISSIPGGQHKSDGAVCGQTFAVQGISNIL